MPGTVEGEPSARGRGAARGHGQLLQRGMAEGQEARRGDRDLRVRLARAAGGAVGQRSHGRLGLHAEPQRRPARGLLHQRQARRPGQRLPRQRVRVPRHLPRGPHGRRGHVHVRRRVPLHGGVQGRQAARLWHLRLSLRRPVRPGPGQSSSWAGGFGHRGTEPASETADPGPLCLHGRRVARLMSSRNGRRAEQS